MLTAKRFAIGVGLAIVLPALVHFGVATFLNAPHAPTYSDSKAYDQQFSSYETKERAYELREFWIALPLGIIAIGLGALIGINGVGPGLMFGGLFTALDGYFNARFDLPDATQFVTLLVTFAAILALGIFKVGRSNAAAERAS